jgi:hypothetical protein
MMIDDSYFARRGASWLNHERRCAVCLTPFRAIGEGIFYCSPACKTEARRRKRAEARKPIQRKPIRCEACGDRFTPIRSTARFCSTRCRMAAHRAAG